MCEIIHPEAVLEFDPTKPDGSPRKLLDVSLLASLGWRASIGLREGVESTYRWYLDHIDSARGTEPRQAQVRQDADRQDQDRQDAVSAANHFGQRLAVVPHLAQAAVAQGEVVEHRVGRAFRHRRRVCGDVPPGSPRY